MEKITDKYTLALRDEIRDRNKNSDIIKNNLYKIGMKIGEKIVEKYFLTNSNIFTPTNEVFVGNVPQYKQVVVVSTLDDYEYFGKGVSDVFPVVNRGSIDFGGVRGLDALTSPLRSITLPEINDVDTLIIAKSVMASGCTAITLTRRAMEKYWPNRVIIATVYYSIQGYQEVIGACKTADIFVIGEPEQLRSDGMLIPGIGDLDKRLKGLF